MKLAPRSYQIFWDAHAWAGVAASLLLHVMFFMGAFALFYPELDVWAESAITRPAPARPGSAPAQPGSAPAQPGSAARSVSRPKLGPLLEQLDRELDLGGARRVAFISGPTGLRASVRQGGATNEYHYSPASEKLEPVASHLGSFLYSMHYLGPLPYGVWMAGLASMALFLALVTGLLIHLKDLARQWFQFRPERSARTWTSDLHKVLGVFGLPFQLLYAWTGAVLCLGYLVVQPLFVELVFSGREQTFGEVRGEAPEAELAPSGKQAASLPDLDALMTQAEQRWPGLRSTWIGLEHVGDEASTLSVHGDLPTAPFGSVDLVLRARDGALLTAHGLEDAGVYRRFEAWFHGLHYAQFGGYGIKLAYALLAFATCVVILTGNLVWLERRDPARARRGQRVLERLTVGIGAGVVPATAGAFVANRLLPAAIASRSVWEQGVFWGVWAAALAVALAGHVPRRLSGVLLSLGGVAFLSLLPIELGAAPSALLAGLRRDVLLGLTALGAASLGAGYRLWRPRWQPSLHPELSEPSPQPGARGTGHGFRA